MHELRGKWNHRQAGREGAMARSRFAIHRANDPSFEETLRRARQSIAEAIRVLETNEPPDTFLGRQRRDFNSPPAQDVIE